MFVTSVILMIYIGVVPSVKTGVYRSYNSPPSVETNLKS